MGGVVLSVHKHRGALPPDGKLESEHSLGPAEPFGPHPNGQFHMIEKKPHKQKAGEESRGNCEEKQFIL